MGQANREKEAGLSQFCRWRFQLSSSRAGRGSHFNGKEYADVAEKPDEVLKRAVS
jgi:hypothetical protein